MLNYIMVITGDILNDVFFNSLYEPYPLMFLFFIGVTLLNMLRKVA